MAKASDNLFPSVLFDEADAPSAPSAGSQRLFLNSSNLNAINSSGVVRVIGGSTGSGSEALSTKGDIHIYSSSNTRLPVGTNGDILTADSAMAAGMKWAAVAASSGKPYIWTQPSSPATEDDEFEDATNQSGPVNDLDAKWSKYNLATASWVKFDDAKAPSCILFDIPTGQANAQHIYQTVPAGDFTISAAIETSITGGQRQAWGIGVVSSTGTGVVAAVDKSASEAIRIWNVTSWAYTSQLASGSDSSFSQMLWGQRIVISLRQASGVYYASFSTGDRLLVPNVEFSGTPTAFVPAYITVGRIYTAGGAAQVAVDWFRKLA